MKVYKIKDNRTGLYLTRIGTYGKTGGVWTRRSDVVQCLKGRKLLAGVLVVEVFDSRLTSTVSSGDFTGQGWEHTREMCS